MRWITFKSRVTETAVLKSEGAWALTVGGVWGPRVMECLVSNLRAGGTYILTLDCIPGKPGMSGWAEESGDGCVGAAWGVYGGPFTGFLLVFLLGLEPSCPPAFTCLTDAPV